MTQRVDRAALLEQKKLHKAISEVLSHFGQVVTVGGFSDLFPALPHYGEPEYFSFELLPYHDNPPVKVGIFSEGDLLILLDEPDSEESQERARTLYADMRQATGRMCHIYWDPSPVDNWGCHYPKEPGD